jgi:hypothetical protein
MTSSQHGPDALGDTHATMAGTAGGEGASGANPCKAGLSSDRRLQPACVKAELLVTAGQPYRGEYVPGPCTHRPSRHGRWLRLKPAGQPAHAGRQASRAGLVTGTKS